MKSLVFTIAFICSALSSLVYAQELSLDAIQKDHKKALIYQQWQDEEKNFYCKASVIDLSRKDHIEHETLRSFNKERYKVDKDPCAIVNRVINKAINLKSFAPVQTIKLHQAKKQTKEILLKPTAFTSEGLYFPETKFVLREKRGSSLPHCETELQIFEFFYLRGKDKKWIHREMGHNPYRQRFCPISYSLDQLYTIKSLSTQKSLFFLALVVVNYASPNENIKDIIPLPFTLEIKSFQPVLGQL